MDINIIRCMFTFSAFVMIIVGSLIIHIEPFLPTFLTRSFCYGKYAVKTREPIVEKMEVPKRWFKHFYIFAAPACTCSLILFFYKYVLNDRFPEIVYSLLDILFGTSRRALVSPECAFLATMLLAIHCWKRLYESCYINVFSDVKINICHYIVGFVHYAGTILTIIAESDGFFKDSTKPIALYKLTFLHKACAIIFCWSTFQQLKTNYILGNLRKRDNKVVSDGYKIPHGGLYEYISAPLQFTEIILYLMLSVILWQSSTFHYITFWVITNQVSCAVMNHKWFKKTFPNYPKNRQILIPYLY